jgi:Na+/proline symporter
MKNMEELKMSEQTPTPEPNATPTPPPQPPPPQGDWRQMRHAERMARREARRQMRGSRSFGWFTGVILVLLGIIFLLQSMGHAVLVNWWALFILFPAFWAFVGAWNIYQEHGELTRGSIASLIIGLLLTLLTVIFLLNLDIGIFWPVLLIIAGLALLFSALYPR